MQQVLNATDVRRDFGQFIDNVTRIKPAVVKRNRDYFMSVSVPHMRILLKDNRFKMVFLVEDDGTVSGSLDGLGIVANAENPEELRFTLAQYMMEYAEDYMNDFEVFYNAPNRRSHFPFVLYTLIQDDLEGVVNLIDV